jgi:hypothetical protein
MQKGFGAFGQPQLQMQAPAVSFGSGPAASTENTLFGGGVGPVPSASTDPTAASTANGGGDDFVVVQETSTQPDEESAIQQLSESTATASDNTLATTYQVEGQTTIPSDNSPHRVALTELVFDAAPRYIAVPKIKKTVFLDVSLTLVTDAKAD